MLPQTLQHRGALRAVRSVLVGLVALGLMGLAGALSSYRADVAEARQHAQERVAQQCRLYADSLALHFEVLRTELQRLADQPDHVLRAPDARIAAIVSDDRNLFSGGVALVDVSGHVVWTDPPGALPSAEVGRAGWFEAVLSTERPAVDGLWEDDSSRVAVALPVREGGRLSAVLVGVVRASDRLLLGVDPGEQLLLLSSRERVLLPLAEPAWSRSPDFSARVDDLLAQRERERWFPAGDEVLAHAFKVRGTSLEVLALESETAATAPVRRRLNAQLAFLLVLQLTAVGAFTLFLRRTWRTFLDVEAKAAAQERMAALGTAASLIAHEVKNSLNGLKAATSLLESGGEAALATRTMRSQVDRLGHLASSLLAFSRPSQIRPARVDLSAIVRETVVTLAALPESAEADVRLEVPPELPLAADPHLLATAVDNLVRNAIEAAVAARDVGAATTAVVNVRARREGTRAVVSVEDGAGGPPPDIEARLGEPFVTSKPRGIGLGLAMTRRAAEQLGGRLDFTRTAAGSRFDLSLPLE